MAENLSTPPLGVDPFESALERYRPRRAAAASVSDRDGYLPTGFTPDGLSYSVAADVSKNVGQSLANFEAATRNPRGLHESESEYNRRVSAAPGLLQAELAPFGLNVPTQRAQPSAKVMKVGDELIRIDPLTGKAESIFGTQQNKQVPKTASAIKNWFATSPTMRAEEEQALAKLSQPGADAFEILSVQHPTLLKNSPYSEKFGPIFRDAERRRARAGNLSVDNMAPNVSALAAERARIAKMLEGAEDLPVNTSGALSNRVAQIDEALTPGPTAGANDRLVIVYNPKGKLTQIRSSQLEKALKLGYTEQ